MQANTLRFLSWFLVPAAAFGVVAACTRGGAPERAQPTPAVTSVAVATISASAPALPPEPPDAWRLRHQLVEHLKADGRAGERVLEAMRLVPRHAFVPTATLHDAYMDFPLPIGHGQTISQPAVVAIMTQALDTTGKERVLEIGTGSGYQAAILAVLCREVYTIEIVKELGEEARTRLHDLGYANVHVRVGDGYQGWPDKAPFDRVIVTAAPPEMPKALLEQLADGGILVAPIGPSPGVQRLVRYKKLGTKSVQEDLGPVLFVPMVPGG